MTDKIQLIIEEIRLKCKDLHQQLELERSKRVSIEAELESSRVENSHLRAKNEELTTTNIKLAEELETTIKQGIETSESVEGNRDAEIDELVREIEYCITQLRK